MTCGIWVEVVTIIWSRRGSHSASTPLPSIGAMHWREVRKVRVTLAAAMASRPDTSSSRRVSRKAFIDQWSWISGAPGKGAASMSCTAGSAS